MGKGDSKRNIKSEYPNSRAALRNFSGFDGSITTSCIIKIKNKRLKIYLISLKITLKSNTFPARGPAV